MFGGIRFVYNQLLAVARVCCIFFVALFLPKFFLVRLNSTERPLVSHHRSTFRLGVENLSDDFLRSLTPKGDLSYTVGLVTNQSGRDQDGKREVLAELTETRGAPVCHLLIHLSDPFICVVAGRPPFLKEIRLVQNSSPDCHTNRIAGRGTSQHLKFPIHQA